MLPRRKGRDNTLNAVSVHAFREAPGKASCVVHGGQLVSPGDCSGPSTEMGAVRVDVSPAVTGPGPGGESPDAAQRRPNMAEWVGRANSLSGPQGIATTTARPPRIVRFRPGDLMGGNRTHRTRSTRLRSTTASHTVRPSRSRLNGLWTVGEAISGGLVCPRQLLRRTALSGSRHLAVLLA